jgi:hypothetical protein
VVASVVVVDPSVVVGRAVVLLASLVVVDAAVLVGAPEALVEVSPAS